MSTLCIINVTNEHIGFYSCKAKNEIGETVTLGKVDITSTTSVPGVTETLPEKSRTITKSIVKTSTHETIETNEMKIQREIHFSKENRFEETMESTDVNILREDPAMVDIFNRINVEDYGPGLETVKELTMIGYLIQQGSSIEDIKNIYNANGFMALKQPESQFALVQLVEREGHGKLITDILIAEHIADDELLASTVGFLAFLKLIEMKHTTVENVISLLSADDFIRQEWKSMEVREVQAL